MQTSNAAPHVLSLAERRVHLACKMPAQVQPSGVSGGDDARPERRRRSSLGRALVKLASTVGGGAVGDSEDEGEEATPLALPPTDPRAASDALMGVIDVNAPFRDDGMTGAAVQAWTVRARACMVSGRPPSASAWQPSPVLTNTTNTISHNPPCDGIYTPCT